MLRRIDAATAAAIRAALGKAHQLFGAELPKVIQALNTALVA